MSMTDPIADFCTRIRNGYSSKKRWIDIPSSLLKKRISVVLKEEGYIDNVVFVNKEDNKELREKFNEQLLNYSVYKSHSEKTKDIRNAIIQRVLLTNDSEFIDAVIEELRAQDKKWTKKGKKENMRRISTE